ncbi:hypothetical protein C8P68_106352 [Mucilaginibacter yixingensis]|uniref:DUF5777 domain-containing protein n=1 Tax=Mucilaginibacter yixingensis TaxID=1295612 RepID=A0A2T5J7K6_9SPHI|nr:DUF5777 family beta-barrel protein [Mucilaginibacter yixingensis]PTQ95137.1 hypothetical protein C8P68_106352 [Mucilaginibacter yixingensis]
MKKTVILLALAAFGFNAGAQTKPDTKTNAADSLMNALTTTNDKGEKVSAAFESSRLILSQSTEMVKKQNLNFLVSHRFGDVGGADGGSKIFWGLDNSSDIFIGFEYGVSDNFNIDFGRNKFEQLLELGLKWAVLHQTKDDSAPFNITLAGKAGLKPYAVTTGVFNDYSNRLNYYYEAIISRKFSQSISLQIIPSYLRNNLPYPLANGNEQNIFALGVGGYIKVTKRSGLVFDYQHPFSNYRSNSTDPRFYDPIAVGWQVQTGGHVFTVNFSNSKAISEINYLSDTDSSWGKGQFRIGFTISRMFDLSGHKEKKEGGY